MEPLEALESIKFGCCSFENRLLYQDEFKIIETALKRLNYIDENKLNDEDIHIVQGMTFEDKVKCIQKLRALDIIIAKRVDISYLLHTMKHDGLEDYNDDMKYEAMYLTEEEYNLLKEVAGKEGWLW